MSRLAPGALTRWQTSRLVRMKTRALYFHSQRPTTLSVRVDFPKGLITEWYPPASKVAPGPSAAMGPVYQNGIAQMGDAFLANDKHAESSVAYEISYEYRLNRSAWLFQELRGVLLGD